MIILFLITLIFLFIVFGPKPKLQKPFCKIHTWEYKGENDNIYLVCKNCLKIPESEE